MDTNFLSNVVVKANQHIHNCMILSTSAFDLFKSIISLMLLKMLTVPPHFDFLILVLYCIGIAAVEVTY